MDMMIKIIERSGVYENISPSLTDDQQVVLDWLKLVSKDSRTENAVEDLRDIKYDLTHVDMDDIDEEFIEGIAETLGEIIDDLTDGR